MPSSSVQLFFEKDLTLDEWHRVCAHIVEAMEEIPDVLRHYTVVKDDGTILDCEDLDHPTYSEAHRDDATRVGSSTRCDACREDVPSRYRGWWVLPGATHYGAFICEECLSRDRAKVR
jgi:hypothetical protein